LDREDSSFPIRSMPRAPYHSIFSLHGAAAHKRWISCQRSRAPVRVRATMYILEVLYDRYLWHNAGELLRVEK